MVQFQSGLCNGPGTVQMDLPLFQFGGQICIFGLQGPYRPCNAFDTEVPLWQNRERGPWGRPKWL